MLGLQRKAKFDPDMLSSIWVMACRDDSPVLTAYGVAYRLGGVGPGEVMEVVKSRREMFRLGLTGGQSKVWKNRYRPIEPGADQPPDEQAGEGGEPS